MILSASGWVSLVNLNCCQVLVTNLVPLMGKNIFFESTCQDSRQSSKSTQTVKSWPKKKTVW